MIPNPIIEFALSNSECFHVSIYNFVNDKAILLGQPGYLIKDIYIDGVKSCTLFAYDLRVAMAYPHHDAESLTDMATEFILIRSNPGSVAYEKNVSLVNIQQSMEFAPQKSRYL